jgi:hypothetical protein
LWQQWIALVKADTRILQLYKQLEWQKKPDVVCNETIPVQWAPFFLPDRPGEPFFQNHVVLFDTYGAPIYETTQHFPHRVDAVLSDGQNRAKTISVLPENRFQTDIFKGLPDEFYGFLSPEKVQNTSWSELVRLEQVWDELRKKTWDTENPRRIVPANSVARFRWSSPKVLDKQF